MDLKNKLFLALLIIIAVLLSVEIATSIYCFINYGNLPISEVPSWALPFMFK